MAIPDYYHITDAGAGDKSGDSWGNAMDEPAFETHLEGAVVAGEVHFIKDGSYTLDSDIDSSARDGTAVSPTALIAVKAGTTNEGANVVYSDWSRDASDRPFFDCNAYLFKVGDFHIVRNLDLEGADVRVLEVGVGGLVENCKSHNDDAVAGAQYALNGGANSAIINCEIISDTGWGSTLSSSGKFLFNYVHDTTDATRGYGYLMSGNSHTICFNVFDNCTNGINGTSDETTLVLNNTFYETDIGVSGTNGAGWVCINNIMEGNDTAGFKWTTQTDINFFWKNHGDDTRCTDMWDTVDTTTVFQDYLVSTGDPKFTTPGSDFSLQSDSPNVGSGMSIELGV